MRLRATALAATCSLVALLAAACASEESSSPGAGGGGVGGGITGGTGGIKTGGTGGGGTGGVTGGTGGVTGGTGGITGGTGGVTGGTGGTGGGDVDVDGDGYPASTDCDDANKDVNPGATEECNGIDDNCDKQIDEGVKSTFYVDADGDNYGVDNTSTNKSECAKPTGFADKSGDCDDKDGEVFPGNPEVCDGKDNDCAAGVDDGVTKNTYYKDSDGDGYGGTTTQQACTPPDSTWVLQGNDCDDADKDRFPGNTEICDGKDNDCDSKTAEPGQTTYYQDKDGDGYGNPSVTQSVCSAAPAGYVAQAGDCNDNDSKINPLAIELCDNIDNNCINGIDEGPVQVWPDKDGDKFGDSKATSSYLCSVKTGYADNNSDCNDGDNKINPNAIEIPGNGIDENCDGKDTSAGTLCGQDSTSSTSVPDTVNGYLSTLDASTGGPVANAYWDDIEVSTTAGQTLTIFYGRRLTSTITPQLYTYGPNSCTANAAVSGATTWGNPAGPYRARRLISSATAGYYYNVLTTSTSGQLGAYLYQTLPGNVGGSCGLNSTIAIWPLGWRIVDSLLTGDDPPASSPVGTGYKTLDIEAYLEAGKTYTVLQGGSTYSDHTYLSAAGACATSVASATSGIQNGGARFTYTPTTAGVYTAWASSNLQNQTGAFALNIVEGNVGGSCFTGAGSVTGTGDTYVLWPLGGSYSGQSLAIGDRVGDWGTQRFFDDYETWMEVGEQINVTVTSVSFTPKVLITRAGGCGTALAQSAQTTGTTGTATYAVTTAGIYAISVTSTADNKTGGYTIATAY